MSVIVLATITPKPGELQTLLDAMAVTVPLVHAEPGCELYAVHTDGSVLYMVERWESRDALRAHSKGENLKNFGDAVGAALAGPPAVTITENVPLGDPAKGTIQ
jgi:quinol monooxygenase YgiN